jgi:protein involved in polysaccharide export with SLBB domain
MRDPSATPVLRRALAHVAWLSTLLAGPIAAQQSDQWDFRSPSIGRTQLEALLARYDAAAQSPAYSDRLRATVRADAEAIRTRLRDGDVRVGDRIRISVEGQPQLTDTAAVVSAGPALILPGVGSVPLGGVLRSEVESQLTRGVSRVYRGGVVRAQLLTRVAVTGGVPRPGYFALPSDARVEDAITAAGGLAGNVLVRGVYIERGRDRLWQAESLQDAMREGRSLAELGVEDGDRIVVPNPTAPRDPYRNAQMLIMMATFPVTLLALLRAFHWL